MSRPVRFIIDARHRVLDDGSLPLEPPRLRRQALRMARLIEYGGQLEPGQVRETLVECSRRPKRKPCPGLLWVEKLPDETIAAFCLVCQMEETFIHHWQETMWADGPMEPERPPPEPVREPGDTVH